MSEQDRRTISPEVQELREAVLELRLNQKNQDRIIETLVADQLENTKYKARIGGIVLAVTVGVSAVWALTLAALGFWRN